MIRFYTGCLSEKPKKNFLGIGGINCFHVSVYNWENLDNYQLSIYKDDSFLYSLNDYLLLMIENWFIISIACREISL